DDPWPAEPHLETRAHLRSGRAQRRPIRSRPRDDGQNLDIRL
ncbi:MAG: hypothetical protein AVDCRST_MAG17-1268, partial [uncultured Solirubrobacterales bacterium]